jgi:hypothetical protein
MPSPSDPSPELATLLRLKNHEQPPDGYFEDFARTFHDRQRAELLTVSVWRMLADRTATAFYDWRAALQPRFLYPLGAACAAAVVTALALQPTSSTTAPAGALTTAPESALATAPESALATAPESALATAPESALATAPARPSLQPGAILPVPAATAATTAWPRGSVPVSTHTPPPPAPSPNGLRRTPEDALVPALPVTSEQAWPLTPEGQAQPAAADGTSLQATHGKIIILVR